MLYTLSRSVRLIIYSLMDENRYAWRGRRANYQVASATATLCESVGIREQAQWQFDAASIVKLFLYGTIDPFLLQRHRCHICQTTVLRARINTRCL